MEESRTHREGIMRRNHGGIREEEESGRNHEKESWEGIMDEESGWRRNQGGILEKES